MSFKHLLLHKNILINITKILEIIILRIKICETICETIYRQEENSSNFHCFSLHKKILNTFEIIELLLKTDIIFSNFSVNF